MTREAETRLEQMLEKHITDSNEWRKRADLRADEMQKCIDRHNSYEVGANAIIWLGKTLIYVATVLGGAWLFFSEHLKHVFSK
jgi:hypothetical protein